MILALLILLISGYLGVRGLLGEQERPAAACLGAALAWATYVVTLNTLCRLGLPPRLAFSASLLLVAAGLGGLGWWRMRTSPRPAAAWDRADLIILALGAVGILALLLPTYLLVREDNDNFIHYPLTALFLRGQFPHLHPYLPHIALQGHYGRDLGLAGLLSFGGLGIGSGQLLEACVAQLSCVGNLYYLAKRSTRNRLAGAAALGLVCFGAQAGFSGWTIRLGLGEVLANNNPVVHAFLFAILVLAQHLVRAPGWPAAILLGFVLGGYDVVYETHFVLVGGGLVLLALLLWAVKSEAPAPRRSARLLAAALGVALPVALVGGGPASQVVLGRLAAPEPESESDPGSDQQAWAETGASQKVQVGFPKQPFLAITHPGDGRPLSLLQGAFWSDQALGAWLFPLALAGLVWRRRLLGVAVGGVALAALLVPATIDFGRFNGESLRFVFLFALASSVCTGMAIGLGARRLSAWLHPALAWGAVALVVWSASTPYRARCSSVWANFSWEGSCVRESERLAHYASSWSEADADATAHLRQESDLGQRLLSNLRASDDGDVLLHSMVVMSQAWLPMEGFSTRLPEPGQEERLHHSVEGWSAQARAFWATGDPSILRDLAPDWLYVAVDALDPSVIERLGAQDGVTESYRSSDGSRRVLRVQPSELPPRPAPARSTLPKLTLEEVSELGGAPSEFRVVELRLQHDASSPLDLNLALRCQVFDLQVGAAYERRDAVSSDQRLVLEPGEPARVKLPFVLPYRPGDYLVKLQVHTESGLVDLGEFPLQLLPPPDAE